MAQETQSMVARGAPADVRARSVGSWKLERDAPVAHRLSRRTILRAGTCCLAVAAAARLSDLMQEPILGTPVAHAQVTRPGAVLFENARIFDGTTSRLLGPSNVLV